MTSTSQGNVPSDPDSLSADQSAGVDKAPKLVPLEELIAQRQKTREAQEQFAQLQAKVAKQRESEGKASPEPLEGIDDLRKTVEQIKTRDRIRDLKIELGLGDEALLPQHQHVTSAPDVITLGLDLLESGLGIGAFQNPLPKRPGERDVFPGEPEFPEEAGFIVDDQVVFAGVKLEQEVLDTP